MRARVCLAIPLEGTVPVMSGTITLRDEMEL